MKRIHFLLSILLLLLTIAPASYAQSPTRSSLSTPHSSNSKCILQLSYAIISGNLGAWYEQGWNGPWGTRVGVLYDTKVGYADCDSTYVTIPVYLTRSLDPERKFCLFGGVQLGYRLRITKPDMVDEGPIADERCEQLRNKLKDFDEDKTSRFQVGLVAGADYECSFGLTLGLYGVKYFVDPGKGTSYAGWELHPSWTLWPTIGYNLMRLFQ